METKNASAFSAPSNNSKPWSDIALPNNQTAAQTPAPSALPSATPPVSAADPFNTFAPTTTPPPAPKTQWFTKKRLAIIGVITLALLGIIGILFVLLRGQSYNLQTGVFSPQAVPLADLGQVGSDQEGTVGINGKLRVGNTLLISPSDQPANASSGQLYFDRTSNQMSYYNGTEFIALLGGGSTTVQNTTAVTNVTSITQNLASSPIAGTVGRILKFTSSQQAGDSIMADTGASITVNGNLNLIDPPTTVPEVSIWPSTATPDVINQPDAHAPPDVELGVRFRSDVDGVVTGIRFYKGSSNTGTHSGSLWTSGGSQLATATFTTETASGWQEVRFSSPVAISADTTYVASYHTSAGFYSITDNYFSANVDNAPLHALQDGLDGPNGTFRYSLTPAFPNQTFNRTNYWVDVLFRPGTNISKYQINGAQISSADLVNNGDLAKRSSSQIFSGVNIFKNVTDSTNAFAIQNVAGVSMLSADTLNGRIYVGPIGGNSSGVLLVLGTKTSAADPAGVEGGMYFNDSLKMFRCYRSGAWGDCADVDLERGFAVSDEFLGGETTTGNIGSLGWSVHTIGGASTIGYDPATPTPVADRPGVLSLTTPAVTNQGATVALAKSNASMIIGPGHTLKTAVAVGSATGQVMRVGLHTQTTATTQPLSGAWWEADPALNTNWQYCYGDGATATCANSGVVIAANTWVRLEIRVTATGTGTSAASFVVNGSAINVTGVTINTAVRTAPALSCYTTTVTARDCYLDYFQLRGVASGAR